MPSIQHPQNNEEIHYIQEALMIIRAAPTSWLLTDSQSNYILCDECFFTNPELIINAITPKN